MVLTVPDMKQITIVEVDGGDKRGLHLPGDVLGSWEGPIGQAGDGCSGNIPATEQKYRVLLAVRGDSSRSPDDESSSVDEKDGPKGVTIRKPIINCKTTSVSSLVGCGIVAPRETLMVVGSDSRASTTPSSGGTEREGTTVGRSRRELSSGGERKGRLNARRYKVVLVVRLQQTELWTGAAENNVELLPVTVVSSWKPRRGEDGAWG